MNNAETGMLLKNIEICYGANSNPPKYTNEALEVWARALADISYPEALNALTAWVLEERWPPTIADIRAKVHNLKADPDVAASQAWDQLLRALRMSYAPEAVEVWNQLPEDTRLIVGGFSTFRAWGNTDTAALESVQRPMFVKRFEEIQRKKRKEGAIPRALREPLPRMAAFEPERIEQKQPEGGGTQSPPGLLAELKRRLA